MVMIIMCINNNHNIYSCIVMFNIIIYKLNNNEDKEKSSPKDVSSNGLH